MMTVLALVKREIRADMERMLGPLGAELTFIDDSDDLSDLSPNQKTFAVAILPASLLQAGTWSVWAELRLLNPRPEMLIYANRASFQLWSGVLDAGCRDVLIEPFSAGELRDAVLDAAKAFEERRLLGTLDECP
jgi:CheY-like chemotaxis protein